MITADQLVAHAFGDYVIQSDWMASGKTSSHTPAVAHAVTYTLPFLLLTRSPRALLIIAVTHFIIDRWRLARHICWLKNFVAPAGSNPSWETCKATGYPPEKPVWLTVWLMIIADNTIHVLINGWALRRFR